MTHIATRRQFSRNLSSGWVLLAAEVAVGFALTPYVVIKLGATQYGLWALMLSIIGYMGLIDVGIRGSVGRYVNHYLARNDPVALDEVVGTANVVLTILSVIALGAAMALAAHFSSVFPKTPLELADDIAFCLPLLALGLWLQFMSSIQGNLLGAKEASYLANRLNLLILAVRAVGTVLVLMKGLGLPALVLVVVGANALGLLLTWLATRHVFGEAMPRLVAFSLARLREMWRYGVASFASRTASTMANDSAPLIGMWVLGPEAVAVYAVAMTLTQYARRLIEQAGTAIFPSVMKAGSIRDLAGLRDLYVRFMDISFAIGSLVFVGMMVFSEAFLGLWVGQSYQAGASVVAILCFGYLMQGVASTAPLTLAAVDRIGITVKIGVGEAVACVLLTAALPGLFGLGIVGMALGATIPRLFTNCLLYPSLAVDSMGAELRPMMWRSLSRNLALSALVLGLFLAVSMTIASSTWPGLVAAVALVTLLHVMLFGHRYEVGMAGRLHDATLAGLRRLLRGARA